MGCGIWPTVIAGAVTAIAAFGSVFLTLEGNRNRDEKRQKEIILGVLQAIQEELGEIYGVLDRPEVKKLMEEIRNKEKDFFNMTYPVPLDYLIIYRSNANIIGQVENPYLRSEIVRCYMVLQSLMERYRTNNLLLDRYHDAKKKSQAKLSLNLFSQLRNITTALEQEYNQFKISTEVLLRELRKESAKLKKELIEPSSERFWEQ